MTRYCVLVALALICWSEAIPIKRVRRHQFDSGYNTNYNFPANGYLQPQRSNTFSYHYKIPSPSYIQPTYHPSIQQSYQQPYGQRYYGGPMIVSPFPFPIYSPMTHTVLHPTFMIDPNYLWNSNKISANPQTATIEKPNSSNDQSSLDPPKPVPIPETTNGIMKLILENSKHFTNINERSSDTVLSSPPDVLPVGDSSELDASICDEKVSTTTESVKCTFCSDLLPYVSMEDIDKNSDERDDSNETSSETGILSSTEGLPVDGSNEINASISNDNELTEPLLTTTERVTGTLCPDFLPFVKINSYDMNADETDELDNISSNIKELLNFLDILLQEDESDNSGEENLDTQ